MFCNIGGKIKTLAKLVCWIGIACSILMGILAMAGSMYVDNYQLNSTGSIIVGLLIIVSGCFVSWIGSFVLLGFGQLVENSDINHGRLQK